MRAFRPASAALLYLRVPYLGHRIVNFENFVSVCIDGHVRLVCFVRFVAAAIG
jgi:hypothetical protein